MAGVVEVQFATSRDGIPFDRSHRRPYVGLALPGYGAMSVVFIATSMANWMLYAWLPYCLYEHFHMSLALAGAYTTYTYGASVAGIVGGGWLADHWGAASIRGRLFV